MLKLKGFFETERISPWRGRVLSPCAAVAAVHRRGKLCSHTEKVVYSNLTFPSGYPIRNARRVIEEVTQRRAGS